MIVEKKKKRVSKRNKTAWRKHSDIRDVEEFLEEQRLEERLGRFDTKKDDELFIVDTQGDGDKEDKPDIKPLSAKQQKRAKLNETPRCFQILLPSSKVEDPNKKRNIVKRFGTKPTALSKLTLKRKIENGSLQKKIELVKKNMKISRERKKKSKVVRETFDKNLWGQDLLEVKGIPETLCEEFISTEAQLHNVLTTQRLRPKPPPPKTVVDRVAIETPHPGVSYNPTFKEHQELLQDVVQHEEKMMKKEAHINRVTTKMFRRISAKSKENQWIEEMSVGFQPSRPQDESDVSDNEYRPVNPPVQNKKKDHKARRKQKEMILEKERLKRQKIDKKKITDIYKLRKLNTSISTKEKRLESEREKRESKKQAEAKTALPALNAHKAPVKEPDFVPPEQLSGDLRSLNASTNLLRDRFESLQRRGALAASKVMMKKNRKVKSYYKAGHKVTDQDVEKYMQNVNKKVKISK
ncbi:ribosome biogenesis protein NOP53 [Pieris brassicae]|uniref:ribosome biogenesis protein NOP53 n=1 Tax=Pieris brassicae TaxID=7116 RepID=UPI001E661520|nr:ribosome biogenesis protein NOP53 [Pieris brassicae]